MQKILFTFPGQGSQFVGMGQKFLDGPYKEIALKYFDEASEVLGFNVKNLCFNGPVENLTLTQNAQPLIVTISSIYGEILKQALKDKIDHFLTMGHSVGEYSALVFCESLSFKDAIALTKARGTYMQEAAPIGKGGMIAVLRVNEDQLQEACEKAKQVTNEVVEIANYNTPSQLVISGTHKACEETINQLNKLEITFRSIPLNVSAPFHCSMMKKAQELMSRKIEEYEFKPMKFPYIPNTTAEICVERKNISDHLIDQITAPVKWSHSIQNIQDKFVCIDSGPGTVTAGLVRKINRQISLLKIGDSDLNELNVTLHNFLNENSQLA